MENNRGSAEYYWKWVNTVVLPDCMVAPKPYCEYVFMDMDIEAEPVGYDPLTNSPIYWGEGHIISCLLEDKEEYEVIPF